jgi:hypothetical protein
VVVPDVNPFYKKNFGVTTTTQKRTVTTKKIENPTLRKSIFPLRKQTKQQDKQPSKSQKTATDAE